MKRGDVDLTKREREIAELFAWGATKKDVANRLFISERTVENHARNIYEKTGCTKVNELSAWWFCTHFHISFDLSPLTRNIIALALFIVTVPSVFGHNENTMFTRTRTTKTVTRTARGGRRRDDNLTIDFTNF